MPKVRQMCNDSRKLLPAFLRNALVTSNLWFLYFEKLVMYMLCKLLWCSIIYIATLCFHTFEFNNIEVMIISRDVLLNALDACK